MSSVLSSIESEYHRYKSLGEGAIAQLHESELSEPGAGGANSVAILIWHLAGNFKSRFTDFLSSDGEKPWRRRDSEFASREVTRSELQVKWDDGWTSLFTALEELSEENLGDSVTIRGQQVTVHEALHRSLAHASYHIGQIVYIARTLRGDAWNYLSIPPGESEQYNLNPTREKGPNTL